MFFRSPEQRKAIFFRLANRFSSVPDTGSVLADKVLGLYPKQDVIPQSIANSVVNFYPGARVQVEFSNGADITNDDISVAGIIGVKPEDVIRRKELQRSGKATSPLIAKDEFKSLARMELGKSNQVSDEEFNAKIDEMFSDYIMSNNSSALDYIRRTKIPSELDIPINQIRKEVKGSLAPYYELQLKDDISVYPTGDGYVFIGPLEKVENAKKFVIKGSVGLPEGYTSEDAVRKDF